MRRNPSRPGLSYFDANSHRLVTEGPDVLEVKREIESRWPGVIEAYFDTFEERWVLVEKCKDGIDRFIMATKALDQSVVQKLQRIDAAAHEQEDLNRKFEADDARAEKEREDRITESIGDPAERLFSALKKDGVIHAPSVFFANR